MNKEQILDAGFDREKFLKQNWQQKPCLIEAGFTSSVSELLDPNEVGGLSMEEFVESRIVFNKDNSWQLENGPFEESKLTKLPKKNWIMLVQALDQLLPEIQALSHQFNFLPGWRFDDVMVSVSAPGGNVGPHVDAYDVFLIQAAGTKTWELMDLEKTPPEYFPEEQLKIISNWQTHQKFELKPGDILYLPPGVGHYGHSKDLSTTISIGFRSPEVTQLCDLMISHLVEKNEPVVFSDPNPPAREHPGILLKSELAAIAEMACDEMKKDDFLLEIARLVSAPKYLREPMEPIAEDDFRQLMHKGQDLSVELDARLFELDAPPGLMVVNGDLVKCHNVSPSAVYRLTNCQSIPCKEALDKDNSPLFALVHKLYNLGALEII